MSVRSLTDTGDQHINFRLHTRAHTWYHRPCWHNKKVNIFEAMTLDEFEALELTEKAEAVWQGNFLADRQAEGGHIQLYALPAFYVEVVYDVTENKIEGFRAFTDKQLLVPYLC